jgi:hypothetical protein
MTKKRLAKIESLSRAIASYSGSLQLKGLRKTSIKKLEDLLWEAYEELDRAFTERQV